MQRITPALDRTLAFLCSSSPRQPTYPHHRLLTDTTLSLTAVFGPRWFDLRGDVYPIAEIMDSVQHTELLQKEMVCMHAFMMHVRR